MFWQNEEYSAGLSQHIYLDGVVCVVDAVFGDKVSGRHIMSFDVIYMPSFDSKWTKTRRRKMIALVKGWLGCGPVTHATNMSPHRQIACSDIILLNKTDIAKEEAIRNLETRIQDCNPAAPIYRTVRGQIDLKNVIGIGAYSSKPDIARLRSTEGHNHDHNDCNHDDSSSKSSHEGISSLQITCPVMTLDGARKLDEWIRAALWDGCLVEDASHKMEILRCKGLYTLKTGEQYVLQGVRSLYEINQVEGEVDVGVPEEGKLVFIGKGLDENVRNSLLAALR